MATAAGACLLFVCLFVCLLAYLLACLSLFVCLHLFVCLFVICLFVCLFVCLHLFACLLACVCLFAGRLDGRQDYIDRRQEADQASQTSRKKAKKGDTASQIRWERQHGTRWETSPGRQAQHPRKTRWDNPKKADTLRKH